MTLIMPTFPRRSTPQAPVAQPDAHANQPRGQVAVVYSTGETWRFKVGGKWERMADNPRSSAITISRKNE